MARDIFKALENYRKKFYNVNCKESAAFRVGEVQQIEQATKYRGEAAGIGLEAGFWIGYQYAKREAREKNKRRSGRA